MKTTTATPISISSIATLSAMGSASTAIWNAYKEGRPFFSTWKEGKVQYPVSRVPEALEQSLNALQQEQHTYSSLDRSVLLAMLAARNLGIQVSEMEHIGVNIGSSRGATQLWEAFHRDFENTQKVSPFTSPTTTLGNISSWVAQDLLAKGVTIEHSVTCSTALHAVLNGIAWLQAGMADGFIAGGSEAALTPFTMAQMKALRLYSKETHERPCESMRFQKKRNTMVLGEGAGMAFLEPKISERTLAVIAGWGFATEPISHGSAISQDAQCFQKSMQAALEQANRTSVDAIVMHAPGTVKGDLAEKAAIDALFKGKLPLLTSNKWMVGHTFAASGMLSLEMAVLMLQHNSFIENPFYGNSRHLPDTINSVMVNAVGFGGNAVSLLISRAEAYENQAINND